MIGSVTIVVPFVWLVVMEATDGRVPTLLLNTSKGSVTMPPGTDPLRTGRYSELSAGADERLMPLEPSRFSVPQFIAEPGSPAAAFAVPYETVNCSPPVYRIQISPEWVVEC